MCLQALIRNVTFPAVQNFLHIYAEQDLRAPKAVMEPSGLNKMSTRILIELKLFAAELPSWAGRAWESQCGAVQLGWSLPDRDGKGLQIKDIIYFLSPSQVEIFFGF